jgi:SAM-dependent methyltransferase
MLDLRSDPCAALAPAPLQDGDALETLRECARGADYRSALEALLLKLPEARSNQLDLVLRECRGAWLPLLAAQGGRALYLGNPLSGTVVGLARTGFAVSVLDLSSERLALAQLRNEWIVPGRCVSLLGGDGARLPFEDEAFDVVVQELGPPETLPGVGYALSEIARVTRAQAALVADNRYGYKRSAGEKSSFRVLGPLEYLRRALRPPRGVRSLRAHRGALREAGLAPARAYALYPHQSDFAYVASFDERGPHLFIGPKERRNRAKLLVHRLGGFSWLAPSYLFLARKQGTPAAPERLLPVLEELAGLLGEPVPEIEQLVATRGNTALVHTSVPGRDESDPRGRWTLHVTVGPLQEVQARTHYGRYLWFREHVPDFPIPEPLHSGSFQTGSFGESDGLFLTCERRLPGLTAPQHTGDHAIAAVMYRETAAHLSRLVVEPARAIDAAAWEQLFASKFDLVARYAAVPSTLEWLADMRARSREQLLGEAIPRVVYHADLRSKHVQVDARGHVLGYLDWGSSEASDLPYFDLLHLIAHERKQEAGLSTGAAWAIVQDPARLRSFERAALEDYRERLGLSERYCRAIEALYPLLVTAMAERNWEYSRPRWMHRSFGI